MFKDVTHVVNVQRRRAKVYHNFEWLECLHTVFVFNWNMNIYIYIYIYITVCLLKNKEMNI